MDSRCPKRLTLAIAHKYRFGLMWPRSENELMRSSMLVYRSKLEALAEVPVEETGF